jgi:hypothetical protein
MRLRLLPLVPENRDDSGVYTGTSHQTYRLRTLYQSLDGCAVKFAHVYQMDSYVYDAGSLVPGLQKVSLPEVILAPLTGSSVTKTDLLRNAVPNV